MDEKELELLIANDVGLRAVEGLELYRAAPNDPVPGAQNATRGGDWSELWALGGFIAQCVGVAIQIAQIYRTPAEIQKELDKRVTASPLLTANQRRRVILSAAERVSSNAR